MRLLILVLSLAMVGCAVLKLPGDQLTQKAKACIDAGMDIQVYELDIWKS